MDRVRLWSGGSRSLPRRRERRQLRDRRQRRQRSVRPITAPARAAGGTLGRRPGQVRFPIWKVSRRRTPSTSRWTGSRESSSSFPQSLRSARAESPRGRLRSERTASLPAKSTCCGSSTLPGRGSWSPPPTNQPGRRRMSLPRSAACSTRCTSLRRRSSTTPRSGSRRSGRIVVYCSDPEVCTPEAD